MNNEKILLSITTPVEVRALSTAHAAKFLALSASFLEKSRLHQTKTPGPKATKIGSKRVVYLVSDLENYLANPPSA